MIFTITESEFIEILINESCKYGMENFFSLLQIVTTTESKIKAIDDMTLQHIHVSNSIFATRLLV
jgi:hypothetical protein